MMSSVDALLVGNENLCSTILECEVHLVFGPPCVERHVDGAHRNDCCERDDPLGEVAHCDGNAIALLDSVLVHQQVSQTINFIHDASKCVALAFIEKECLVAVSACALQDQRQVLWSMLEDFHLVPKNVGGLQFKHGSGTWVQDCVLRFGPRLWHGDSSSVM